MTIMDDGIRLDCVLTRPEGMEKGPAVLLIHGFTGNKDETHILAAEQVFLESGMTVLRADMYGHGRSGGEFKNHTLYKWLGNTLTLIDYLRSLDFVTDLYLCGHSQGGLTVMLAAAMKADAVRGLMALSPAAMIPEGARKGELLGQVFPPDHVPDVLQTWGERELSGNYIRVAQTIHVEDAIDRYEGPVLLLHGSADGAVLPSVSEKAAQRYKNADLRMIPGDGHCYEVHLDQAMAELRDWITGQLRKE